MVATLLIGMVLVSLGTGYFVRKKVKNISRRMRNPKHYKQFLMHKLNLSADQQTIVEPMIASHFKMRRALRKKHFKDLIEVEQRFHKALEPHLEDDQMAILKRRLERIKRRLERIKRHPWPRGRSKHPHDRPHPPRGD